MKKYLKIILTIFIFLLSINTSLYSFSISDLFEDDTWEIPYCREDENWNSECWINEWVGEVKNIEWMVTDQKFSEYSQWIVAYILGFIYLVAIALIIYAWFNILTWVGDDEKVKKSKKIIFFVVLWILIIFLANPLIIFVENILNLRN